MTRKRTDFSGTPPLAMTVDEFCLSHRLSRSALYGQWKAGIGPRFFFNGNQRRITPEAAADWRAEREAAAATVEHKAA